MARCAQRCSCSAQRFARPGWKLSEPCGVGRMASAFTSGIVVSMTRKNVDISRLLQRVIAGWLPFGSRHCVICGHDVWWFLAHRGGSKARPALVRELDVVCSDVDHFGCPHCGSHDRERHLLMYFEATRLLEDMAGRTIVHFAPEKRLSQRIAATRPEVYVKCDLYPVSPDVERVDLLAMKFPSESVDLLIANHVLEHVTDDSKALSEIHRVLKVGGYAILQTPYSRTLHRTWEDAGITSAKARRQAFGQEDHVRLYGRDIFDRFTAPGFESHVEQHSKLLADFDPGKFGVNAREPFFLFRRVE